MIANGVDTFYADPTAAVFVSDSTNTLAAQPAAYSNIDAKRASHIAVLRRGEGKLPELWDDMRVSNEFSSDVAAGELEDIILRAASSSAVPNVTLPWSLDAVVPAATTATTAGWTSGISYYTAQADAGTLPQDAPQNTALHNTAPQQFHQEWSNGGAWTNSGRGEYQLGNAAGWAPPDFQGISRQNASTASTIADTVINERTDDDFATGGDGMPQLWSQGAGGTAATAAAVGISSSRAARHDGGGGFSPSHLPAILRSLAAHQQAVEALAPLVAEPQRQAGEWDGRTGEAAASAAAEWRSSASMAAAAAAVPQAPGFLPAEGVFPPLPLTRPAPAALFQRSPRSAALAAAFPATSSSASSAHLAASVAASLAGERLALVAQEGFTGGGMSFELSQEQQQSQTLLKHGLAGGGRSFETSQEQQRPQALPGGGLAGGGIVSKTSAAEGTAEPAAAQSPQNPSAIDALASMILVAAAAAGGQGGGFAGPPQGGVGGGTSVGAGGGSSADGGGGGMDGGDATGGIWGAMGGGTGGGMGGGMVGGVGGEVDEWHNTDAVGKGEAGVGWHGYGDGYEDVKLQRRNTATSVTGNMGGSMGNMGNIGDMIGSASADTDNRCHTAAATNPATTTATAPATASAVAKRFRRSSSNAAGSSAIAPLFEAHQNPSTPLSSPQNLRLPAANAALPLSAQFPQSLREQLQQQLQLQELQRQTSNLSGSVSGGGGASGGGASGGAASGGEGRPWAGTNTTTTSLGGMAVAVSGAFSQHTQTTLNAPSPLPTSPQPAANPLHPPRSTFPPSGPPDSPLADEKPIAAAQATADLGRKRQARGETRKRGRGGERGGRAAGGRQQGGSEGAWEGEPRGAGAGGASASVEGFEDGEGVEGTRILGRVSGACLAARKRRERIASQMRTLQRLVPGSSRVDTVSVLSDTIRFLCSLIHQIQSLGAEPEGYSTTEAVEAAAAEVQKLIRDGVIASPRPPATQRGPHEGATAAEANVVAGLPVAAGAAVAAAGRTKEAGGDVAISSPPQGSAHTSSHGPSQSMLPTVSTTSPSLDRSLARGDGDAASYADAFADADAEADADGTKDGDGGERDGDMEKGSWSLLHKNA